MNRVDRLLALILFLQSRRVTTAEQLAEHFELSVRTIYRDLAALGEAGVPIVAEAGVGYALMRGYHLPPVNFTAEEAIALVTGGMLIDQFADASVKAQMHSALLKVRAILPRDHQERAARLERGLATTANVKSPPQTDLSLLQKALANRRILHFRYQAAGKTDATARTAEPLGLIRYLERWHLIAWCRACGDYRDFRTDRMSDVTVLRETFTPPEDFSLAKYIRAMPAPKLQARVLFTPLAADRAKREWWRSNGSGSSVGFSLLVGKPGCCRPSACANCSSKPLSRPPCITQKRPTQKSPDIRLSVRCAILPTP